MRGNLDPEARRKVTTGAVPHWAWGNFSNVQGVSAGVFECQDQFRPATALDVGKVPSPMRYQRRKSLSVGPLESKLPRHSRKGLIPHGPDTRGYPSSFLCNIYCTIVKNPSGHKPYRSCQEAGFNFSSLAPLPLEHVTRAEEFSGSQPLLLLFSSTLAKAECTAQNPSSFFGIAGCPAIALRR